MTSREGVGLMCDSGVDPMRRTCGAKTRAGHPCRGQAMRNGRCRMHGGASTGPRTPEGLARLRARRKHGLYTNEMIAWRRLLAQLRREARRLVEAI